MRLQKDFEEFIRLLNKNGIKYLIVGGYAFAYHAYPRFTQDIDIFIQITKINIKKIIDVFKQFGFEEINISEEDIAKKDKIVQLGYPPNRIDIITSISGVSFNNAWKNKVKAKFGKEEIFIISLDDYIKNKKASNRKKDNFDIDEINRIKKKKT